MAKKYGIKVSMVSDPFDSQLGLLIEQLRYAGVVGKVENKCYSDCTEYTFILYPHSVSNSKMWAESNAKRMNSFGIQAEAILLS